MNIEKFITICFIGVYLHAPCYAMKLERPMFEQRRSSFGDIQDNHAACLNLKNKIEAILKGNLFDTDHYTPKMPCSLCLPRTMSTKDFLAHPVSSYFLSAIKKHEYALLKTCILSTFNIFDFSLRSLSIEKGGPLFVAVDYGIPALVEILLLEGVAVDSKDNYDQTPLYYAIKNDDVVVAKLLLDAGACVAVRDYFGNTPLHCAIKYNNPEMIALLLTKKEINPFDTNGAGANVFFLANQYDFLRSHIMTDTVSISKNIEQREKCIALLEDWKKKNPDKKGICFIGEYY